MDKETITLTTGASLKLEKEEINWKTLPKFVAVRQILVAFS
jgi:hypothetical protein